LHDYVPVLFYYIVPGTESQSVSGNVMDEDAGELQKPEDHAAHACNILHQSENA